MVAMGLVAVFVGLVTAAAVWDVASFTIPNKLTICTAVLFFAYAAAVAMPFSQIGYHLLAGLGALFVGFAFFAFGWVGGGDAKLFAAAALWIGPADVLLYALAASIVGGGLTLGILWFRRQVLCERVSRYAWIMRLHDEQGSIPYGVALAVGALVVLPDTELLSRFAG